MEDAHCTHDYAPATCPVHGAALFESRTGAVSTPIYQSSTFRHPGLYESTGFDYSRGINPTRAELERTVARLEKGQYGLAFATGMGAISALIKIFG
ncbi:MAG: PLP-dependent transferase, partial [Treponema sp.]|nr:PLP-dependent transferase [Treponema sp.]